MFTTIVNSLYLERVIETKQNTVLHERRLTVITHISLTNVFNSIRLYCSLDNGMRVLFISEGLDYHKRGN